MPEWCVDHFLPAHPDIRHKIIYGGRGSAKSWSAARMAIIRCALRPVRFLCARELQVSIRESVHALLVDQIVALELQSKFKIYEREIQGENGSLIMFKGLRGMRNDASAIRSLEAVDICWIEEAQYISEDSLETLLPTIRKKKSEIWYTMNPNLRSDPVYKMIENPPDNAKVFKVNWDSNPWFNETGMPAEREYKLKTDPDGYRHVWEGFCREYSDSQVLKDKYVIEPFEPSEAWGPPLQGADWGFSQDPTVVVRIYVAGRRLYVYSEAYAVGCEIDETPQLFSRIDDNRHKASEIITRADPARPETISYMKRHGFPNVMSAPSWKGSVQDGVAYLRSFETIVIHPQCKHAIEEAALWSFKVDQRTNDVLTDLRPGNDHVWDAVRYALGPMIKQKPFGVVGTRISSL